MTERIYSTKEIEGITGASQHEDIRVPFYYAPPFLDILKTELSRKLKSCGGRRTIPGRNVIRKVRFSDLNWDRLKKVSSEWSEEGASISPAQVASVIVEISLSRFEEPNGSHVSSEKRGRRKTVSV